MKRIYSCFFVVLLLLSLAACATEDITPKDTRKDDVPADVNANINEEELSFSQSLLETCLEGNDPQTVKIFETHSELESWITSQTINQEEVACFFAKYDAKYFEEKCLVVLALGGTSSTSEYEVTSVIKRSEGDKVNYIFTYTDTNPTDPATDDIVHPVIAVELDAVADITEQNAKTKFIITN